MNKIEMMEILYDELKEFQIDFYKWNKPILEVGNENPFRNEIEKLSGMIDSTSFKIAFNSLERALTEQGCGIIDFSEIISSKNGSEEWFTYQVPDAFVMEIDEKTKEIKELRTLKYHKETGWILYKIQTPKETSYGIIWASNLIRFYGRMTADLIRKATRELTDEEKAKVMSDPFFEGREKYVNNVVEPNPYGFVTAQYFENIKTKNGEALPTLNEESIDIFEEDYYIMNSLLSMQIYIMFLGYTDIALARTHEKDKIREIMEKTKHHLYFLLSDNENDTYEEFRENFDERLVPIINLMHKERVIGYQEMFKKMLKMVSGDVSQLNSGDIKVSLKIKDNSN